MGGTVVKLARQGHRVHLLDVTTGEPTPRGSEETRAVEKAAAAKILGVERTLLGLTNRQVEHSLESRYAMAAMYRKFRPDVIFLPYPVDAHPDHVAVTRIGEDARFDAKLTKTTIPGEPWHPKRIIYYFCTHLRLNINPSFCIDISDTWETKWQAVNCYASQFTPEQTPTLVRDSNAHFGNRIGTRYAEPFYSHEVLGFSGLGELV